MQPLGEDKTHVPPSLYMALGVALNGLICATMKLLTDCVYLHAGYSDVLLIGPHLRGTHTLGSFATQPSPSTSSDNPSKPICLTVINCV